MTEIHLVFSPHYKSSFDRSIAAIEPRYTGFYAGAKDLQVSYRASDVIFVHLTKTTSYQTSLTDAGTDASAHFVVGTGRPRAVQSGAKRPKSLATVLRPVKKTYGAVRRRTPTAESLLRARGYKLVKLLFSGKEYKAIPIEGEKTSTLGVIHKGDGVNKGLWNIVIPFKAAGPR